MRRFILCTLWHDIVTITEATTEQQTRDSWDIAAGWWVIWIRSQIYLENLNGRNRWVNPGLHGKIILKRIVNKSKDRKNCPLAADSIMTRHFKQNTSKLEFIKSGNYWRIPLFNWAGQRSRYSECLRAGRSGDRIPVGAKFSAPVQIGRGTHPASCTTGAGSFPGVKSGQDVMLTPHRLLVPWTWKGRAIPLFPYGPYSLYRASVPVQGCTLPLAYHSFKEEPVARCKFEYSDDTWVLSFIWYVRN